MSLVLLHLSCVFVARIRSSQSFIRVLWAQSSISPTSGSDVEVTMGLYLLVLTLFAFVQVNSQQLPSFIKPCPRNDPALDSCVRNNLVSAFQNTMNGNAELGVETLDPYKISELLVTYDRGPISAKIWTKNVIVRGFKSLNIDYMRLRVDDSNNINVEGKARFPQLFIEGIYRTDSRFVLLPLLGKGRFNISLTDIEVEPMVEASAISRNNVDYLKIDHIYMKPVVGDMKIYFDGLFGRNRILNEIALDIANEFWDIFYGELLKSLQGNFDKILTDTANMAATKIPLEQLLPRDV